jgi:hypothetical protein
MLLHFNVSVFIIVQIKQNYQNAFEKDKKTAENSPQDESGCAFPQKEK